MTFDRGLSIGLFLFSGWVLYLSTTIPRTAIRQTVGPEVMTVGIGLCLMLASVALFIRTLRVGAVKSGLGIFPEGVEREDRVTQALILLGIVAYMFLLEPLGFIVATSLLCIYVATLFEARKWIRNVLVGVGFSVAVYAMFVNLLEVLLPTGILGW